MAEKNSSEESSSTSVPDNSTSADQTPTADTAANDKSGGGGGGSLGIVAILLSVAALGASIYVWYRTNVEQRLEQGMAVANITGDIKGMQQRLEIHEQEQAKLAARLDKDQQQVTARLDKDQQQIAAQYEKLSTRQGELDETIQTTIAKQVGPLKEQQAELAASMDTLTQSVEKVYADLDRSLDSWALEEIEQLLRIANHSAILLKDSGTALAALQLADRRLEALGNPKLLQVRTLIAEETATLKTVEPVDVAGIALQLATLSGNLDKMELAGQVPERTPAGNGPAPEQGENQWIQAGREIVADLRKLVRIQNVTKPAKPLLAPEERYFLYGNLRLMLSGAQFAALQRDGATYTANLEHAKQWLGDYFNTEQETVTQAVADIGELLKADLSPDIPDISASLAALKKIKAGMTQP